MNDDKRCWHNFGFPEKRCPNMARWKSPPELLAGEHGRPFMAAVCWCDEHHCDTDVPLGEENAETNSAGQGPDLPVKDASKPSGRTTPAQAESDTSIVDVYQRNNAIDFRDYSRITELARQLERHARALAEDLTNEESRNLAQSTALRDWRAFCEERRNG